MAALFLDNLKGACVGQMTIAAAGNRRREHGASIVNQIGHLFLEIDLNRGPRLRKGAPGSKNSD